jgi:hypothetical protein
MLSSLARSGLPMGDGARHSTDTLDRKMPRDFMSANLQPNPVVFKKFAPNMKTGKSPEV